MPTERQHLQALTTMRRVPQACFLLRLERTMRRKMKTSRTTTTKTMTDKAQVEGH